MADQETILLGIVGIKNMGEYNSQTNYEKLNVVTYQGSTYCALKDTLGNLPTNTEYWQLYAERGGVGPQGPKPEKGTDYFTEEDITSIENDLKPIITSDISDEVTSQLGSIVSATPLGASSMSDMTDTSRIYVLETDGHWYWYNGTEWRDGGLYQSDTNYDEIMNSLEDNEIWINTLLGKEVIKNPSDFVNQNYYNSIPSAESPNNRSIYFDKDLIDLSKIKILKQEIYPEGFDLYYRVALYDSNFQRVHQFNTYTYANNKTNLNNSVYFNNINNNYDFKYISFSFVIYNGTDFIAWDNYQPPYLYLDTVNDTKNYLQDFTNELIIKDTYDWVYGSYINSLSNPNPSNYVNKRTTFYDIDNIDYKKVKILKTVSLNKNSNLKISYLLSLFDSEYNKITNTNWVINNSNNINLYELFKSIIDNNIESIKYIAYTIKIQDENDVELTWDNYQTPYLYEPIDDELEPESKNTYIVDINGNGDFTTIQAAVNYASPWDTLLVMPGEYYEEVDSQLKPLIIKGYDKYTTKLISTNGRYAKPPLEIDGGIIENLTIYAKKDVNSYIASNTEPASYGIHIDFKTNYPIIVKDCIVISDFWPAMGIGMAQDKTLEIENCELISNQENTGMYIPNGGLGALYFHNRNLNNVTNQNIKVRNCLLKSKLENAMTPYDVTPTYNSKLNMQFSNNILYSEINGYTNNIWWRNENYDA